MTSQGNRFAHHAHLQAVADEDVRFVKEKDVSYGASWKRRGGVGVFMMLARKWDRLEEMVGKIKRNEDRVDCPTVVDKYDVLAHAALDLSGTDGTVLAEVRDLRRYLLLVESEILARSAGVSGVTVDKLNVEIEAAVRVSDYVDVRVDWSPTPTEKLAAESFFCFVDTSMRGRDTRFRTNGQELHGMTIRDNKDEDFVDVQVDGAGIWRVKRGDLLVSTIVPYVVILPEKDLNRQNKDPGIPCDSYHSILKSGPCQNCSHEYGTHKFTGTPLSLHTSSEIRDASRHARQVPAEDSNRHADRSPMGDNERTGSRGGRNSEDQEHIDRHALLESGEPRQTVSAELFRMLSEALAARYVLVGKLALLDRAQLVEDPEHPWHRYPQTLPGRELAMLPDWMPGLYEPRDGVPGEVQLKPQYRTHWGR